MGGRTMHDAITPPQDQMVSAEGAMQVLMLALESVSSVAAALQEQTRATKEFRAAVLELASAIREQSAPHEEMGPMTAAAVNRLAEAIEVLPQKTQAATRLAQRYGREQREAVLQVVKEMAGRADG